MMKNEFNKKVSDANRVKDKGENEKYIEVYILTKVMNNQQVEERLINSDRVCGQVEVGLSEITPYPHFP